MGQAFVDTLKEKPVACVDVIIATYNAEKTIARAIASALAEPEVATVIVVDDASTDHSLGAARGADDGSGRLVIVEQSANKGPSAARNRAIEVSGAPWITVLDSDDFFLPGRIANLLKYSDQSDFIADNMWQVEEGDVEGSRTSLLEEELSESRLIDFGEFVLSNIPQRRRQRAELGFIKPLMRRAFLNIHGITYRNEMRLGEDYELYARALGLGARLHLVPGQGYVSVVRSTSLSASHSLADLVALRAADVVLSAQLPLAKQQKRLLRRHFMSTDCRIQWQLLIDAVKERNLSKGARTFMRPWPVPVYLAERLLEQVWVRLLKKRL